MGNGSFMTVQEVSEILRTSTMTIYRLIWDGELAAIQVGRQWRIKPEDLGRYMERNKTTNKT